MYAYIIRRLEKPKEVSIGRLYTSRRPTKNVKALTKQKVCVFKPNKI